MTPRAARLPTPTRSAPSPSALFTEVAGLVKDLLSLLESENARLLRLDFDALDEIGPNKIRLGNTFAGTISRLRKDKAALMALPAAERRELDALTHRLHRASIDNAMALKSARDANQHLMGAVVRAAERQKTPTVGYGRGGRPVVPPKSSATALTMFQDRRL